MDWKLQAEEKYMSNIFNPISIQAQLYTMREKCPYSELFWSVSSRI